MKKHLLLLLSLTMLLSGCSEVIETKEFYESNLVNEVNVTIDPDSYQAILDDPLAEEFYQADVVVNDEQINNVGIRTKGNSTLTSLAKSDSTRYSYKIKLDKYENNQTSQLGADEFVLNNMYADPSYMREYISYQVMAMAGLEVPYSSYAKLSINGEYMGLYLMVESIDDAYLKDHFGNNDGKLYKADLNTNLIANEDNNYQTLELKNGDPDTSELNLLIDTINDPDASYEQITSILDVDSALAYIAFNTVFGNYDSYNGDHAQNFYLYLNEGKFYLIPWDYNMSFDGYPMTQDGSSITVDPLIPVNKTTIDERPLITALLSHDEAKSVYLSYIELFNDQLKTIDIMITELDQTIGELVNEDPTSFYTYEEYAYAISYDEAYEYQAVNKQQQGGDKQESQQQTQPQQGQDKPTPPDAVSSATQTADVQVPSEQEEKNIIIPVPLKTYAKFRSDYITQWLQTNI